MTKKMMMIAAAMFVFGVPTMAISQTDAVQAQNSQLIDGQVTKIDESAGKVTIKHGTIKKFDHGWNDDGFPGADPGNAQIGQGWRQSEFRP